MLAHQLHDTVEFIRSHSQLKPRIGMILGSGLGAFAETIKKDWSAEYSLIPNFGTTSVEGHQGRMIMGHVDEVPVVALQGRLHLYEGYNMTEVVYPTRTLAMLGIEVLLVTNAAGGLNKKMRAGDFMAISDHINLMGDNPLRGKNMDQLGPRFPDMTEAYDKNLVEIALHCARKNKLRITPGVYVGLPGPTYETPAEVRYLQKIGGNAVGMSTVPEVIAANHFGVRVCGVSCITNLAAGISKQKLSHEDVTTTAAMVSEKFQLFVKLLVKQIAEHLDEAHRKAKEALQNAYAPYSKFRVGCVVVTGSGKTFAGCNMENAAFPAGLCAERNAIAQAVVHGERTIKEIYLISSSEKPCFPCGICLQVISEFGGEEAKIISSSYDQKTQKELKLKDLLPFVYDKTFLKI